MHTVAIIVPSLGGPLNRVQQNSYFTEATGKRMYLLSEKCFYGETDWETHVRSVRNETSPRPIKDNGLGKGCPKGPTLLGHVALTLFHCCKLMLFGGVSVAHHHIALAVT